MTGVLNFRTVFPMRPLLPLSLVEQTAEHLREGFRTGHWCGVLPGVRVLARELNVSKDTMERALRLLEREGSLRSGGLGKRREIAVPRESARPGRVLRVGILLSSPIEHINSNSHQLLLKLVRRIENAGHICTFSEKSMREVHNRLSRITRMVTAAQADAWLVYSAPADVVRWFSGRSAPALLIGGEHLGSDLAVTITDLSGALHAAVRELTRYGHRRIVVVSPDSWRVPEHNRASRAFLTAMKENGHQPSTYNLPNWECSPAGLENLLNSLFQITPPTALLFVDPAACVAALGFSGRRGLLIPRDISILCMTSGTVFDLLPQRLAHFEWPIETHIHRIVRWVERIAMGEVERQQTPFSAVFHPGETIGPANQTG